MPVVTVPDRPSGLPTAIAGSPTLRASESARSPGSGSSSTWWTSSPRRCPGRRAAWRHTCHRSRGRPRAARRRWSGRRGSRAWAPDGCPHPGAASAGPAARVVRTGCSSCPAGYAGCGPQVPGSWLLLALVCCLHDIDPALDDVVVFLGIRCALGGPVVTWLTLGGGDRQCDDDGGPATRGLVDPDRAAVGLDDRVDDGQPEPVATALATAAAAVGAVETLKDVGAGVDGYAGSVVAHVEGDVLGVDPSDEDLDGGAVGRVHTRVGHEVGHDLPQLVLVGPQLRRLDRSVDAGRDDVPARRDGARVLGRVGREDGEVDGLQLEGALAVEAREGEQVLDEPAHPVRLGLDAPHGAGHGVGRGQGTLSVELGVAADGCE